MAIVLPPRVSTTSSAPIMDRSPQCQLHTSKAQAAPVIIFPFPHPFFFSTTLHFAMQQRRKWPGKMLMPTAGKSLKTSEELNTEKTLSNKASEKERACRELQGGGEKVATVARTLACPRTRFARVSIPCVRVQMWFVFFLAHPVLRHRWWWRRIDTSAVSGVIA